MRRELLVAAALAGGCATTVAPPSAPPPDVPRAWTADPPPAILTEDVAGTSASRWWSQFASPELDLLVERALAANHDLRTARARVAAADALARVAGADRLPAAAARLDALRAKRVFIGFPIPGAEDFVLSTTSTQLGVAAEVQWEADLWGRIAASHRAALAEVEAADEDRRGAELAIAGRVVRGWLALIEARQQVDLGSRTLENRRRSRERVEARYRRGLTGSLDVRLARSEEALAASALEGLERARDEVARGLEVLAGSYPEAALEAPGSLPVRVPPVPALLPAEVVTRRPDLAAAERRLAAAGARVEEARAALYPRLSLTGSTGTASADLGDLLDGDFSVWSLAAGILQPIFQGGRLRAAVDLERAGEEALLAEYAGATLQAFAEVESALAAERRLGAQVEALEAAAAESRAAEELAGERYGGGLETYLSVLEAQRQSFVSESQLLARRRDRLAARVDLILALGGGFDGDSGAGAGSASAGSGLGSDG